MSQEGEFRDLSSYTELPFDPQQIAEALGTNAERVYELRGKVLPNTSQEIKDRLWRITLSSEDPDKPSETVVDLDDEEHTIGLQVRTGIDRDNYAFEGSFENVEKIVVRDNNTLMLTMGEGLLILVTPGHVNITNIQPRSRSDK